MMASSIHKKRTGRGFKVTEEIVLRQEMYEEEEDLCRKQHLAFTGQIPTSGLAYRRCSQTCVTDQIARQQEINRLFAQQFPGASSISPQWPSSTFSPPPMTSPPVPFNRFSVAVPRLRGSESSKSEHASPDQDPSPPALSTTSDETALSSDALPPFTARIATLPLEDLVPTNPLLDEWFLAETSLITAINAADLGDPTLCVDVGERTDGAYCCLATESAADAVPSKPDLLRSAQHSADACSPDDSIHGSRMETGTWDRAESWDTVDSWDAWLDPESWQSNKEHD